MLAPCSFFNLAINSLTSARTVHISTSFLIIQLFLRFVNYPAAHNQNCDYHYPDGSAADVYAKFLPLGQLLFDRVRDLYFLVDRHLLRQKVDGIGLCHHLCQQVSQAVDGKAAPVRSYCLRFPARIVSTTFPFSSHSSNAWMIALSGGNWTCVK